MARPTLNNRRRSGYDVTGCVDLKDVECIKDAVRVLFNALFPRASFKFLNDAFDYCHSLYHGKLPDYHAAETPYHDYQHVMDVTLATMRLIDGYQKSRDGAPSHLDSEGSP